MSLVLRRATAHDAYALWLWANDPETQRASFRRGPISWSDHVAWLRERLCDAHAIVLVAEDLDGRPVASIRFDTRDDWRTARLSFVVAPEARGNRLARPLVVEGVRRLREPYPGVTVHAEVDRANERSLRVFRGERWVEEASSSGVAQFWWR